MCELTMSTMMYTLLDPEAYAAIIVIIAAAVVVGIIVTRKKDDNASASGGKNGSSGDGSGTSAAPGTFMVQFDNYFLPVYPTKVRRSCLGNWPILTC